MSAQRFSPLDIAISAWGGLVPDWIMALAREADRTTLSDAAHRIKYSVSAASAVLRNKYKGDMASVEAAVRGALLGDEIECPVLGELRRDRCLAEQKKNFTGTSAIRTRLYNACRSGCLHSMLKRKGGADDAA